ncbi:MAG: hypothetical protein AABX04_02550 [Nanoarchaeota archaeon]
MNNNSKNIERFPTRLVCLLVATGAVGIASIVSKDREMSHSLAINELYHLVENSDKKEGLSIMDCLTLRRLLPERFSWTFYSPFRCQERDIRSFLSKNYLSGYPYGLDFKERVEVYQRLRGLK